MSRFVILAALAALVLAVPATHDAFAAKEDKVLVCHLNSSNTPAMEEHYYNYYWEYYDYYYGWDYGYVDYGYSYTWWFGNVIEVAASAVAAHVGHGDSTYYYLVDDYPDHIDYITSWDQYDDADYYTYYYDDWPYYYYYESGYYSHDYTNGEVKNADCFFYTHN